MGIKVAVPVSVGLRDDDVLWHVVGGHKVQAANIAVDPFNVCLQAIAQVQSLLRVLDQRECCLVALPASLQHTNLLMPGTVGHSESTLPLCDKGLPSPTGQALVRLHSNVQGILV